MEKSSRRAIRQRLDIGHVAQVLAVAAIGMQLSAISYRSVEAEFRISRGQLIADS
jgi:hypothetical protein